MAEWVTYKNHKIKACSQCLVDDRWVPMALAWLSTGNQEHIKTIQGELSDICSSENEANKLAMGKAQQWVDQKQ
jgi:hypothetical protein